ncbi:uncharacterized protein LOC142233237 [Haematobia irritans]|uniref:uncharacterized protein LOC142233237 n=1 Tax=Haematobia irritans TaxID=7368 RepID=UPI003F507BFD
MSIWNLKIFIFAIWPFQVKIVKTLDNFHYDKDEHLFDATVFKEFLFEMDIEANFENSLIFGDHKDLQKFDLAEYLVKDMEKVILLQSTLPIGICYKCLKLDNDFIVIIYWKSSSETFLLEQLSLMLNFKRETRILLIVNQNSGWKKEAKATNEIFKKCNQLKLINVIIIVMEDFEETRRYWRFQIFPQFKVEYQKYNRSNSNEIFPYKLKNLYGHPIQMYPDQMPPRSVMYHSAQGQLKFKGYLIYFLDIFARSLNATLDYPKYMKENQTITFKDAFVMAQEEKFDILGGLVPAVYASNAKFMSYPFEVKDWCLMIPKGQSLSYRDFLRKNRKLFPFVSAVMFSLIMEISMKIWYLQRNIKHSFSFRNFLINPKVFSGLFGWSFKLLPHSSMALKILYTLIFVRGLMFTVHFSAILQSFLTHPVTDHIRTFKDLQRHQIKIWMLKSDFEFIAKSQGYSYDYIYSSLELIEDSKLYWRIHASFNMSYAYPVHHSQWYIYNSQQKRLRHPLFYLSEICVHNMGLMGFVVPPNSYFLEPLNHRIMRIHDMGLIDHWLMLSYHELKRMGRLKSLRDNRSGEPFNVLHFGEFKFIWIYMGESYMAGLLVLLMEIVYNRLSRIFKWLP